MEAFIMTIGIIGHLWLALIVLTFVHIFYIISKMNYKITSYTIHPIGIIPPVFMVVFFWCNYFLT